MSEPVVLNRDWLDTVILLLVLIVASPAHAADQHDLKARMAVAPSKAACIEFAQRFHEFGEVHSLTFESAEAPVLVTWIEPYPDRKPMSFVFGYFLRDESWHLFLDEVAEARSVSVRMSEDKDRLIVASGDSAELFSRSVQNLKPLIDRGSR